MESNNYCFTITFPENCEIFINGKKIESENESDCDSENESDYDSENDHDNLGSTKFLEKIKNDDIM